VLDLVLKGGLVVDGTGAPRYRGDVGISGDRIAALGDGLVGRERLDCAGHVVCPGFIDAHSHSDLGVLADPILPMKLRQGITLEVLGQDGISVAPVRPERREEARQELSGLLGDFGVAWSWSTIGEYLHRLREARPAQDMAYLVPHGAIRSCAMGDADRPATGEELARMRQLLVDGLEEGACGLSTGLIYPPCCYAPTEELIALGRVLAQAGRPLVVHLRSESDRLIESLDEMIRVAQGSGCAVHVSHLKIAGRENWHKAEELLSLAEGARGRGHRITADQYPYAAGSTLLGAILPPWAHDGGIEATLARLRDAGARSRLRSALSEAGPGDWDNFWKWSGPEGIVIADIPSGHHPEWLGRSLAEVAREVAHDPFELAFDLLLEERLGAAMLSFSQDEDTVERFLTLPWAAVCTDGLLGGRPHPRAFGSFPRILGRYVREQGWLGLEEAVRKMTAQAADAFGFADVGRIREGLRANLVVFDPATVADRATFEEPMQFPVGIRDVLVGGRLAVHSFEPTGIRAGLVTR
jgi:N-acyl-D-amino-acid deacylase